MTPREFCFWLDGRLEGRTSIDKLSLEKVKGRLAAVLAAEGVNPGAADDEERIADLFDRHA